MRTIVFSTYNGLLQLTAQKRSEIISTEHKKEAKVIDAIVLYANSHPVEVVFLSILHVFSICCGYIFLQSAKQYTGQIPERYALLFAKEIYEKEKVRKVSRIIGNTGVITGIVGIILLLLGMSGIIPFYNPATIIAVILDFIVVLIIITY